MANSRNRAASPDTSPPTTVAIEDDFAVTLARVASIDVRLQLQLRVQQQRFDSGVYEMLGLVISTQEIEALLKEPMGLPRWAAEGKRTHIERRPSDPATRLGLLRSAFSLSEDEIDILLLAMMPHFDARYGTLFGYMQDDVKRKLPTVELAVNTLGDSFSRKIALQNHLVASANLVRYSLVRLGRPAEEYLGQWNQSPLVVDVELFHYLAGLSARVPSSDTYVRYWEVDKPDMTHDADVTELVATVFTPAASGFALVGVAGGTEDQRIFQFHAAASQAGFATTLIDLDALASRQDQASDVVRRVIRDSMLRGHAVLIKGAQRVLKERADLADSLAELIATGLFPSACLIDQSQPLPAFRTCRRRFVTLRPPSVETHLAVIDKAIRRRHPKHGIDVAVIASRYPVTVCEIPEITQDAELIAEARGPRSQLITEDILHVLRYRSRQDFGRLAQRRTPVRTRSDLLVPAAVNDQLEEILCAVRSRDAVLQKGFQRKLGLGFGVSALFHGASGAGKTLAAEVLAGELGRDVIQVNLANVVDKYIGETEKNLARIFDSATDDHGVLFFDEADALFGKRTEVKDAHDRYANIEVSYLLQRLESYPGLVILASNNRGHLDQAFTRRLTFIVRFTPPDAALRQHIWQDAWPEEIEFAEGLDFQALAERYDFTGGNIRNVALLSSWLAQSENAPVNLRHVVQAADREMAKSGHLALR